MVGQIHSYLAGNEVKDCTNPHLYNYGCFGPVISVGVITQGNNAKQADKAVSIKTLIAV